MSASPAHPDSRPVGAATAGGPAAGWPIGPRWGGTWSVGALPAGLFAVLAALTVGLWNAERLAEGVAETGPRNGPWVILAGGLALSALLAAAAFRALWHRDRSGRWMRHHLAALESLNRVAAALTARPDAGPGAMAELAEAAQRLLDMDSCGILRLVDGSGDARDNGDGPEVRPAGRIEAVPLDRGSLELLAGSGDMPRSPPRLYPLAKLPASRAALATGRAVFDGDTDHSATQANPEVVRLFRARSLVLIPLQLEGERIGLLTLCGSRPRRFTDADRRLVELLGAQASVILANSRLYGQMRVLLGRTEDLLAQTRRDADDKAMLLRELNHRVKNNLAGIVGLLSVGEPDMPPPVRQWLDRAVDRIRLMAGAHDLFAGGVQTVTLPDLVERTLSSLSVAKPANVDIRTELSHATADGRPVALATRQAVAVAMALHELCFNALVHGLRGGGTLTIRAREARVPGELAIDVSDAGQRPGPPGGADGNAGYAYSSGMGLALVRGLVGRELRGHFSVGPNTDGGTTATMEFPVSPISSTAGASGRDGSPGSGGNGDAVGRMGGGARASG